MRIFPPSLSLITMKPEWHSVPTCALLPAGKDEARTRAALLPPKQSPPRHTQPQGFLQKEAL